MDSDAQHPQVEAFFDKVTGTVSYVVHAAGHEACAIIDPVLDFDPKSGRTSTAGAQKIVDCVRREKLRPEWIIETHAHADHLSAAPFLKKELGGEIVIGAHIRTVQGVFKKIFNLEPEFRLDGSQFDRLAEEGDAFPIGPLNAMPMHVPGHTPADMAWRIGDAVFVGDTMFMPDVGTARCDFPGGDARRLYRSIHRILALDPDTRIFVCHDYPPEGRGPQWETSVRAQRETNIHVREGVSEDQFVELRTKRDRTLEMPTLILPSVQVNIRAGELPPPDDNGTRYLRIPLNAL